jgi:hypothetical protein
MEPEGSLPHSQAPANCPYPEPAQSKLLLDENGNADLGWESGRASWNGVWGGLFFTKLWWKQTCREWLEK